MKKKKKKKIHAINAWNTFKRNTMADYHNLYLKTCVLLLADVFEKFINTYSEYYGLDPFHYFSSLGLIWDPILKKTKIELELISDTDMHLFVEKEMSEGINNKYMKSYDPNKLNKYIAYVDSNSLYGQSMSKYLPDVGFKWLNKKEIDRFDVNSISEDSSGGYRLELDFEYCDELHYLHNDYLLALEKREITCDMLSDYCKKIADEYGIKVGCLKKVLLNLGNKSKYVVH